jgi:hypothetical protein
MVPEYGKPIHQLPLIPANVLKKHRVHEPLHTRFRRLREILVENPAEPSAMRLSEIHTMSVDGFVDEANAAYVTF